jgi:hypothetical protein
VYVLLAGLLICVVESSFATGAGVLVHLGLYLGVLAAIALAVVVVRALRHSVRDGSWPAWCSTTLVAGGVLASLLCFPLSRDVRVIRDGSGVQANELTLSYKLVNPISSFLISHQDGARYEAAFSAPTLAAPFIIEGLRPVLLLTSVAGRPLVTLHELREDAARGEVRYVFIHGGCVAPINLTTPACSVAARWVRAHATDVTAQVGIATKTGLLYKLPTGRAALAGSRSRAVQLR